MHATDARSNTPAATEGQATGSAGEREPLTLDTLPEQGNGRRQDSGQPDWLARHDLLRRRGRRGPDPEPADSGIRLRRARRVFAPFTALPSLARPPLNLRSRRR